MTRTTDRLRAGCAILCLLGGCVLPDFEAGKLGELVPSGPVCGLSNRLPQSCDACIRSQCCGLAQACGEGTACGDDLLEPITPVADYSTDFDELLGCMQNHCATECKVHWGCVDQYSWPEAEGPVDQKVGVVDFASSNPVAGATVRACEASDPTLNCRSGTIARAVTDDAGQARLRNLPRDIRRRQGRSPGLPPLVIARRGHSGQRLPCSSPLVRRIGCLNSVDAEQADG